MTVAEAFDLCLKRIELDPTRVDLASRRYQSVKETLERSGLGITVRQIGSFQRKTKIRPADLGDKLDLDVLACLGEVRGTPSIRPHDALSAVRRALVWNDTYEVMAPTQDAPVIVLRYRDNFAIEIVAAYTDQSGQRSRPGGPPCYLAARRDGWQPADYEYDAKFVSDLNQGPLTNQKLVPAIKITKAFLRAQRVPLHSFHIEILVANALPDILAMWTARAQRGGFEHILAGLLQKTSEMVVQPVRLKGSYSLPESSGQQAYALAEIGRHLDRLGQRAWEICRLANATEQVRAWRDFVGNPFPAA